MRTIDIIPPPREGLIEGQPWVPWQQWFDRLFKYVGNTVLRGKTTGDAAATIKPDQSYHGITALSAPRTITLPSVDDVEDNHVLVIQDESGSGGTHTITIAAASGETVNGTATITSNFGRRILIKSNDEWYSA